jgi:C1A family cysteine protease
MFQVRSLIVIFAWLAAIVSFAQNGYKFSVIRENPITPVKNQASTGTCWSFSGVGMLESELIRMGKGVFDLSEMYIVRRNYEDKHVSMAI